MTLSGSVVKGPVTNANVCAYKATSAGKGDLIKCVTTGAAGTYSLAVDYAGDIVVEAKDGTYVDEATGATKTLSDPMQVVVAANGGTTRGFVIERGGRAEVVGLLGPERRLYGVDDSAAVVDIDDTAVSEQDDGRLVFSYLVDDLEVEEVHTVADAEPELRESSPEPSIWPLLAAIATTILFVGSIFTPWMVVWGSIPLAITLIGWFWPKGEPEDEK